MEIFSNELAGSEPSETIFPFPYNASTPELESWLPGVGGTEGAEAWLDHDLRGLMALPEGWGILRSEYLTRILERLVALPVLKIVPAREILALAIQLSLFVLYD